MLSPPSTSGTALSRRTISANSVSMKAVQPVTKRGRTMIVRGPTYFAPGDEKAFFDWLLTIPCVADVGGKARDLHISLKRSPSAKDMVELSALLLRYRMPIKVLEALKTSRNVKWLKP